MDLETAANELYALSPDEFVDHRQQLVAEARKAGDRTLATQIGKLRRPTRSAWLINLLARQEPDEVTALLELGAGWGRWIVNGVAALRAQRPLPYHVVGVEAEPTHFTWMRQHLADNDVDPRSATLIEAAVAKTGGSVWFHSSSIGPGNRLITRMPAGRISARRHCASE